MSEDEYRRRILDVERHYDARAWRYGGRGDLYMPDAQECIAFLTDVVDADFYGAERPNAPRAWMKRELELWEARAWRS